MTPDRPAAIPAPESDPPEAAPWQAAAPDGASPASSAPTDPPAELAGPRAATGGLDAIAFSSGLPALIAASLSLVASQLMNAPSAPRWAALAAVGSFIVYTLDRLRDVERDRATSPQRTAFVERNRGRLAAAVAMAALAGAAILVFSPLRVSLLCAAVGAVGLLHRRLKTIAVAKTLYVSLAWTAACVGLPRLAVDTAPGAPWIAAVLLTTITANLIASNLRDGENQILRGRPGRVLWIARASALIALLTALAAPAPLGALAWIPLAELGALAAYRASERYGHLAVDGALLVGALASLAELGLT